MAETAVFVMDKSSYKTESQNKSTVLTILNLTVIPYFYSILQTVIIRYLTLEPVYCAIASIQQLCVLFRMRIWKKKDTDHIRICFNDALSHTR